MRNDLVSEGDIVVLIKDTGQIHPNIGRAMREQNSKAYNVFFGLIFMNSFKPLLH